MAETTIAEEKRSEFRMHCCSKLFVLFSRKHLRLATPIRIRCYLYLIFCGSNLTIFVFNDQFFSLWIFSRPARRTNNNRDYRTLSTPCREGELFLIFLIFCYTFSLRLGTITLCFEERILYYFGDCWPPNRCGSYFIRLNLSLRDGPGFLLG